MCIGQSFVQKFVCMRYIYVHTCTIYAHKLGRYQSPNCMYLLAYFVHGYPLATCSLKRLTELPDLTLATEESCQSRSLLSAT